MSGSIQMPFWTGQPQQTLGGMPGQMGAPFGQPTGPTGSINPMQSGQMMQPGPFGMPQGQAPFAPPPVVPPMGGQPGMQPGIFPGSGQQANPNLAMFGQFAHLPLQPPGTFQPPGAGQKPNSPAASLAALMASLQGGARSPTNVPSPASFNQAQPTPQTVAPFSVGSFTPQAAAPAPAQLSTPALAALFAGQVGGGGGSEAGGSVAEGMGGGGDPGGVGAEAAGGGGSQSSDGAGQGGGFG